jgi:hypothetical protein
MKHMAYGKAALLGVFVLAGCYSYASEAINNADYNTLQASPNFVVIKLGDSDRVIARLINGNNNGAVTSYSVSAVGAGIRVDSSCTVPDLDQAHQVAANCNGYYRPIFDASKDTLVPTGDKTAQQFFVLGLALGQYTFTLTPTSVNTGVSRTVTVVVTPTGLGPALSKTTAVAGDTVTITAPTGTVFSQTSAVTFQTGSVNIVGRSADSTTITFQVSSAITGPATVTLVGTAANPAIPPITLLTSNTLTTPALVGPTLSVTSPPLGSLVVLTAAPNTAFSPNSAITISTGPTPPITARAADSSTITFIVGPGDSGAITVTNVAVRNAPALPVLSVVSTNSMTLVPPVTVAPTVISNVTPGIGQSITVQLGASLRFINTSHILIGGVEAGVTSISADSSTATIVPFAPSSGALTYTNIALSFLTSVPLAVPANQSITVGATYTGPTDPTTTVPATAPTITLVGAHPLVVGDGAPLVPCTAGLLGTFGGGSMCKYYKITIAAGKLTANIHWGDAAPDDDLGLFLSSTDGTTCKATLSDDQGATSGLTGDATLAFNCAENAAFTPVAGTYLLTVAQFGYTGTPSPPWQLFRISQP